MQQRLCRRDAHHRQHNAAEQRQQHGGMHRLPQGILIAGPDEPGRQDVGAHRQPHEQIHQQIDERRVGAHRRQRVVPGEFAHHHNVRRVEQQLQNAGAHQRQGKSQYFRQQLAAAHVDLVPVGPHDRSPSLFHQISPIIISSFHKNATPFLYFLTICTVFLYNGTQYHLCKRCCA